MANISNNEIEYLVDLILKKQLNTIIGLINDYYNSGKDLVKIIEKHKNDPNDIFITGGNGDGGIGIVIENKISGAKKSIVEGPLKIDTPIDFIKKAVAIGDEFTKKMRKPLGIKQRIQEILDMM